MDIKSHNTTAPKSTPEFLTSQAVADALNVSIHTVNRWCRDGHLQALKLRRGWRIPLSEFQRVLTEGIQ